MPTHPGEMSLREPALRFGVTLLMLAAALAGPLIGDWRLCSSLLATGSFLLLIRARIGELDSAMWEHQARSDPLTGIGNYRQLHERLQQAVATDPNRFALLTMDVDSFKQINDVHATSGVVPHLQRTAGGWPEAVPGDA